MSPPGHKQVSSLEIYSGENARSDGYAPLALGSTHELNGEPYLMPTEVKIVEWMSDPANEGGALRILSKMFMEHPTLWRLASTSASYSSSSLSSYHDRFARVRSSDFMNKRYTALHNFSEPGSPSAKARLDDRSPVVMFNDSVHLAQEEQGFVEIHCVRVGDVSQRSEVCYTTRDASAKSGVSYLGQAGTMVFEPGVTDTTIEVTLIPNELWDTTLEFYVSLESSGAVNANIDRWMSESRVKIFNDDPFPTNMYKELLVMGSSEQVPKFTLIRSYLSLTMRNSVIWKRSVKAGIVHQLHNLVFLAALFMNVYMFDHILNKDHHEENLFMGSRQMSLFMLVVLRMVPFMCLYFLDYLVAVYAAVGGPCKALLQSSLLRQYFYCLESHRLDLGFTGLLIAMSNDTDMVVSDVYIRASEIFKHIGKLVAIFVFQLTAPLVFGKKPEYFPLLVMFIFPVMMIIFVHCRQTVTYHSLTDYASKHHSFCQQIDQICSNFQMITTFGKQDLVEAELVKKVNDRNTSYLTSFIVAFNNRYFAKWLSTLVMSAYTVIGGLAVINGLTSMGYFVTAMGIFAQMGSIYSAVYGDVVTIQAGIPALVRITNFLNMAMNLRDRQEVKERNMQIARSKHIDCTPIVLKAFDTFLTDQPSASGDRELLQGQMIAITSPRSGGKSTLLRLIGGVTFPPADSDVHINVPSHLRTLWIGSAPLFFLGTLSANLLFGMNVGDPDRGLERMVAICSMIGLKAEVIEKLYEEEVSAHWHSELSESTCHVLNMVRALMATPDVLCLEKPTLKLDEVSSDKVLSTLREFVTQKGLECSFPARCRRPRTVIYTTERMKAVNCADTILHIDKKGKIEEIAKGHLTEHMMYESRDNDDGLKTDLSKRFSVRDFNLLNQGQESVALTAERSHSR